jgi:hypothetical protein
VRTAGHPKHAAASVRTSLAGVDKNNDGIRDDIKAFVLRT